ncbi:MAG: YIP1 family protein [Deltaproteobacteria bacterium]|nr:MAG: YIP1 family protein [Deltaproteobacteria bacterium]
MENHKSVNSEMPEPIQPQPSGAGLISGFIGTAKAVILSPRVFFPAMPIEGGLLGPYVFFLLCTFLYLVVSVVLNVGSARSLDPRFFLMILVALAMPFLSALLLYTFLAKLWRTGASYEATFRVVCYASAVNLVSWIPILGIFFQFYEIYLSTLGLSIVHRTTMGRALLAVVATALTLFLAVFMSVQSFFIP